MTIREAIFALQTLEKAHPGALFGVKTPDMQTHWEFDLRALFCEDGEVEGVLGEIKYVDCLSSGDPS